MKKINKLFTQVVLLSMVASLAGCQLDLSPEGDVISKDQKEKVLGERPNLISTEVNALAALMNKFGTMTDGIYHNDYGYPAVCMILDAGGQDLVAPTSGYNWFRTCQDYSDRNYSSLTDQLIWKILYNQIKAANNVIALTADGKKETALYRGQALAVRAFDYLQLIQVYQFTYDGHKDMPGVPIVTEATPDEARLNNPRATVAQVYDLIMSDLNSAIELLKGYDNGDNKDHVDEAVAYGLRARANLLMHNWQAAADDAAEAIKGGTPQSIEEVSNPTFNSARASSWLWGVMVAEDNDVVQTGIINWPSHLCSLTGNGYTTGTSNGFRRINSALYAQIPDTDIRKQWFISPEGTSKLVDNKTVKTSRGEFPVIAYWKLNAYANVKFGPYKDIMGNTTNASDWPVMRVEEMYLIRAEALAMAGKLGEAKSVLEGFVRTYRDPAFTSKATDAKALQDEVWMQRRVELWGEGFALTDLLRLKKPVKRIGTNFASVVQFDISAEDQILIYRLPEVEMRANKGISDDQNNPIGTQPTTK